MKTAGSRPDQTTVAYMHGSSMALVQPTCITAMGLRRQVAELQQELAMHDAMAGRSATSAPTYTPYSEQQRAMLRQQVGGQELGWVLHSGSDC